MKTAGQELVRWLKEYNKPYIIDGNKLLLGESTFTVLPSIESDSVHSFRLDMPERLRLEDSQCWMLFFIATIGAEGFCSIQPRMKAYLTNRGSFDEVFGPWHLRLWFDGKHAALLAEALSQPSS